MTANTIIFDGECNLCNGVVAWLLQHAPKDLFKFVPFQSEFGQSLLKKYNLPTNYLDSVILINCDGITTHSDGFLKIISQIKGYKNLAFILTLTPRFIRDTIYKIASKNRLKWFGASKQCIAPF